MGFHTSRSEKTKRGLCIYWKANFFITVPFEYRIGLGSYLGDEPETSVLKQIFSMFQVAGSSLKGIVIRSYSGGRVGDIVSSSGGGVLGNDHFRHSLRRFDLFLL